MTAFDAAAMINHVFISLSAVEIYDLPNIHVIGILHHYEYITNSYTDQLPDGLIAQFVEHCAGIAEVMGSNPVRA